MFPADRVVITLSGSFGTNLVPIAERLAQLVHLPLHAAGFTTEELMAWAEDAGTSDQFLTMLLATTRQDEADGVNPAEHCLAAKFNELGAVIRRTVLNHAVEGGILIESCAAQILAGRPNTLHVRLNGPLAVRIQRYADEHHLDPRVAADVQRREAGIRSRLASCTYGYDPEILDAYDLVVNTRLYSAEVVAQMIARAAGAWTDLRLVGA